MIRVCFLIRQLNLGGAQRQLIELVKGLDKSKYDITVMTFYDGDIFSNEVKELIDVRYISLKKKGRWDVFFFMLNLIRSLCTEKPDIIISYLGVSNILAVVLKPLFPNMRVIWSVRASNMDLNRYDWLTRLSYRVECWLSNFADLIIVNSHAGFNHAIAHGFPKNKMIVIPNGIDIDRFRPDPELRKRVRDEWGLTKNEKLIGLVGRLDPMKDHHTFLRAAALLIQEHDDVRFVCVGDGPSIYKSKLQALAGNLGLNGRLIWAGNHGNMPAVYNAFDIAISSSSFGEGFPNVIGEAMSCGVPCVVTDVGDSAWILGDTGIIVLPQNPVELNAAILKMLDKLHEKDTSGISNNCRMRIIKNFSISKLVTDTMKVLQQ